MVILLAVGCGAVRRSLPWISVGLFAWAAADLELFNSLSRDRGVMLNLHWPDRLKAASYVIVGVVVLVALVVTCFRRDAIGGADATTTLAQRA